MSAALHEDRLWALFSHPAPNINIGIESGLLSHYNGIEIVQYCDYVKIHVGK
jgi:hypothetical protein